MHPMFFGIKRLYLRIVECSKALSRMYGLTPARFDILRTIHERDGEVAQHVLVEFFGVADSTISRMLTGLEEKGFIVRSRLSHDGRFKSIRLTPEGLHAYRGVLGVAVTSLTAENIAAALVSGDRHAKADGIVMRRRVETMTDRLVVGRRLLHDRSVVRYPWRNAQYLEMPGLVLQHDVHPAPVPRLERKEAADWPAKWELQLRALDAFHDEWFVEVECPG